MRNIKNFINNLSHHPGVYQMLGHDGEVLYVGKARDLKKRVASYFSNKSQDIKTQALVQQIENIDVTITNNENEAVLLECNLIKKHKPRYNVLLRDDKSYPYIVISTNHPYARIDFYRGRSKKNGLYFGPYPSAYAVRETISLLQKIFRIRTCTDAFFSARIRPCLLYQIDRCTGPCVGLVAEGDYQENVKLAVLFLQGKNEKVIQVLQKRMEKASQALNFEHAGACRDQIARLRKIQEKQYVNVRQGNLDIIGIAEQAGVFCIQLLTIRNGQLLGSRAYFPIVLTKFNEEEVLSAFIAQHYLNGPSHIDSIPKQILVSASIKDEVWLKSTLSTFANHNVEINIPDRGEKRKWLQMATTSAKQSLLAHLVNKTNLKERFVALKQALGLKDAPKRIECFDISHSMGEATVASCVVFDTNGPVKNDYRRFNIQNITPGDDVAAMQQVVYRRFKRQKDSGKMPDLVLIDGGPTQLKAAHQALDELKIANTILIGVAKGRERKPGFEILHRLNHNPIHMSADAIALHLIQQVRDEAHRFAITGHRVKRDKSRQKSTLETIPGIGANRRRALLRYFGGIQGLHHASLDELAKVPGISRSLAERIFATLHDANI